MFKTCCNCKITKDIIDNFCKHKSQKDGLNRECKSCVSKRQKKNALKKAKYDKEYSAKNALTIAEKSRSYRQQNRKMLASKKKIYIEKKESIDVSYKLARRLRARLYKVTVGIVKTGSSVQDLGCSVEFLKQHLESLFLYGMKWENWGKNEGKWQIDHKKPLSSFDLTDRKQMLEACHYTNLQPIWYQDHVVKTSLDSKVYKQG